MIKRIKTKLSLFKIRKAKPSLTKDNKMEILLDVAYIIMFLLGGWLLIEKFANQEITNISEGTFYGGATNFVDGLERGEK